MLVILRICIFLPWKDQTNNNKTNLSEVLKMYVSTGFCKLTLMKLKREFISEIPRIFFWWMKWKKSLRMARVDIMFIGLLGEIGVVWSSSKNFRNITHKHDFCHMIFERIPHSHSITLKWYISGILSMWWWLMKKKFSADNINLKREI